MDGKVQRSTHQTIVLAIQIKCAFSAAQNADFLHSGEHQLDVLHTIFKRRLDENGVSLLLLLPTYTFCNSDTRCQKQLLNATKTSKATNLQSERKSAATAAARPPSTRSHPTQVQKVKHAKEGKTIDTGHIHDEASDSASDAPAADAKECGSCYGAETVSGQCCNTCDEVREAYRSKVGRVLFPQCESVTLC